jgi:uncharacterized integral membrane protein
MAWPLPVIVGRLNVTVVGSIAASLVLAVAMMRSNSSCGVLLTNPVPCT